MSKLCDVDDKTVKKVREQLEASKVLKPSETRTDTKGRSIPSERKSKAEPKASPDITVDTNGTEIPKTILKYWNDCQQVNDMIDSVSWIIKALKKAEEEKDMRFCEVSISSTLGDLTKVRSAIECAIPYCVCTQCGGHPETQPNGQCRMCLGRGLISEFRWRRLVPKEIQDIIIARAKKTE